MLLQPTHWKPVPHCVCRPAHALYFATYELAKQRLGGNDPGHHPVATAVAGSIATIVNDGVMTPSDVVKQRLQVANSPYRGMMDCILRVSREEGLSAFFRSYKTTVRLHSVYPQLKYTAGMWWASIIVALLPQLHCNICSYVAADHECALHSHPLCHL